MFDCEQARGQACSRLILSTYWFHCLSKSKKSYLLRECLGKACSKLILSTCLFSSLMLICMQKIKVRQQLVQEILRIKGYSDFIGWQHAKGRRAPDYSTLLVYFINGYPDAKNPSQTLIHSRDTEDQIILTSDWPRAFLTEFS